MLTSDSEVSIKAGLVNSVLIVEKTKLTTHKKLWLRVQLMVDLINEMKQWQNSRCKKNIYW